MFQIEDDNRLVSLMNIKIQPMKVVITKYTKQTS